MSTVRPAARPAGRPPVAAPASRAPRPASRRNITVYAVGVLALACAGGALMAAGHDVGGLVFILSPLLMAVVLRRFGGDGWADAGMRPRLRGNGRWYLLAAVAFPVMFALALALGVAAGQVELAPGFGGALGLALAANLVPRMLFALSEELGWRGYLEPRLAALGVAPARRHLMVAALWGVWHVPYILALEDYTDLPRAVQLPLFLAGVTAMSYWYGVVRERTGSVWPAVVAHGVANVGAFPLLTLAEGRNPLVFSARPEGLVVLACLTGLAVAVWRRSARTRDDADRGGLRSARGADRRRG